MSSKTDPADGDTYTYTPISKPPMSVDISGIDEVTVDYLDGAGGADSTGGSGGRVDNVAVDVSGESTLYLWIAEGRAIGRYYGDSGGGVDGAASTEIALVSTDRNDSSDEPFLVAAGGGGGGSVFGVQGGDGARGGAAEGIAPPQGGDGAPSNGTGGDAEGAIDSRGIISGGTTTTGGGAGAQGDGEAQISYTNLVPTAPTNLSATLK